LLLSPIQKNNAKIQRVNPFFSFFRFSEIRGCVKIYQPATPICAEMVSVLA